MAIAYAGGHAARSERYMKRHWDHAKGFVSLPDLEAAAHEEETAWVAAQKQAGLDFVSPAYVRWEDMLRPLCKDGSSVVSGQLTRYFETNTFFRQPDVNGPVASADPKAWLASLAVANPPWVLTLPSPWDFAVRANAPGRKPAELAQETGEALHPVVDAAFAQGCKLIRFHDPSLAYARGPKRDTHAALDALKTAAGSHAKDSTLHITNGDPFSIPDVLEGNPLGGLSIENPGRTAAKLKLPNGTKLSAAVIHGEESLIEDPTAAARNAVKLAENLGLTLYAVTNGWDLGHVPHSIALRKLTALAHVRTALQEVTA